MRIDWFRIIVDLERAGFDYQQIALEVGVTSKQTIGNWKTGAVADPPFTKGLKLLNLHQSVCPTTTVQDFLRFR